MEAIASAGTTVKVVGFDAGPDEIAAIVAGDQLASVAQFPAKMGEMGCQAALDAINGEDVAREHRHRHRDRHRGQRQRVRRLTATWPPGMLRLPRPGGRCPPLPDHLGRQGM